MTEKRRLYLQKFYKDHKKKLQKYFHSRYVLQRKKRLSNQRKHYKINKEEILAKNKMKSLEHRGHAHSIWNAVRKYALKWKLPICTFDEFFDDWTKDDLTYQTLWDTWKASGYNEYLSPVVMRAVKNKGYVPENLKWDVKKNYSWWNEDSTIFKDVMGRLETQQKERNQRSKEWRKKVREQFKAKQKEKK